jgi:hypothetical protein
MRFKIRPIDLAFLDITTLMRLTGVGGRVIDVSDLLGFCDPRSTRMDVYGPTSVNLRNASSMTSGRAGHIEGRLSDIPLLKVRHTPISSLIFGANGTESITEQADRRHGG